MGDLDVAVVSPGLPPGVAHDEVVHTSIKVLLPADRLHGVVDRGRAVAVIVDAALVVTERWIRGVQGDRGRAFDQEPLKAAGGTGCRLHALKLHAGLARVIEADPIHGIVGVVRGLLEAVVLNILVALCEEAAVAAVVSVVP